jgi:hypothetical protein
MNCLFKIMGCAFLATALLNFPAYADDGNDDSPPSRPGAVQAPKPVAPRPVAAPAPAAPIPAPRPVAAPAPPVPVAASKADLKITEACAALPGLQKMIFSAVLNSKHLPLAGRKPMEGEIFGMHEKIMATYQNLCSK